MHFETPTSDDQWRDYLECRYRNLYQPFALPRTVNTSELDSPRDRPEVMHGMIVVDGAVAACGRLDFQPGNPAGPSSQLRYCAVDTPFRGKGAGQMLLARFEEESRSRGLVRLWMEARTAALNFYARLGYIDIGEGPTKYGCIPHRIMEKRL